VNFYEDFFIVVRLEVIMKLVFLIL